MIGQGLVHAWLWRYNLRCQPIDWSDSPDERMVVFLCWCYYVCKLTELLDTVFFVLRKKFDQITHLHVIHHTIMPLSVWWGVRYVPSGIWPDNPIKFETVNCCLDCMEWHVWNLFMKMQTREKNLLAKIELRFSNEWVVINYIGHELF